MTPDSNEENAAIIDDITDNAIVDNEGRELWEHYRIVAEKGQALLRVDKREARKVQLPGQAT